MMIRWDEQGTLCAGRYTVVPRTLTFLTYEGEVLLLRGATDKPLWAGKLNGMGGHIEPDEDPLASARREVLEETGLAVGDLALRAVVHVAGRNSAPGVILFVFVGSAPSREVHGGREGALAWYNVRELPVADLMADLPQLLPRVLACRAPTCLVYGHYASDATGQLSFRFAEV